MDIATEAPANRTHRVSDLRNEHDACGMGFVANIKGRKSHDIVEKGLRVLENLTHRGAVGEQVAGRGAGILSDPRYLLPSQVRKLNHLACCWAIRRRA